MLVGAALCRCSAGPEPPASPLEPRLGHSQPVPDAPPREDSGGHPVGPRPGAVLPLEQVIAGAVYTPDPDPRRLAQTKAALVDKQSGVTKIGFCVGEDGTTRELEVLVAFPGDPRVDAIMIETVASWRFKPFVVSGEPVRVCTSQSWRLEFEQGEERGEDSAPDESAAAGEDDEPTGTERPIPPPAPVTAVEEELCRHITSLVLAQSSDASPPTSEQVDELIISCALTLAQDRRQIGEQEFQRRAKCVRSASSLEAVSACGSS